MKRRSVIMIIMTFMLLTLVGVGFAAWIITAPTTDSTAGGNIKVDTVTSQESWAFSTKWVDLKVEKDAEGKVTSQSFVDRTTAPEIVFGTPAESIEKAWLTNTEVGQENLTAYLYIIADADGKVAVDTTKDFAKIEVNVVETIKTKAEGSGEETVTEKRTDFNTHLAGNATVSLSTVDDTNFTETAVTAENGVLTLSGDHLKSGVYLKVQFNWKDLDGEKEGIENPYAYYNGLDYSAENAAAAEEYLKALYGKLNGLTYEVVLKADKKSSTSGQQ